MVERNVGLAPDRRIEFRHRIKHEGAAGVRIKLGRSPTGGTAKTFMWG
jgi:hypothetical protein